MPILTIDTTFTGQVGVSPRIVHIATNDTYAEVIAANYLVQAQNVGYSFYPNDYFIISYGTTSQTTQTFTVTITSTTITLDPTSADVVEPTQQDNFASFANATGKIEDSGVAKTGVILTSKTGGQTAASSTTSATPGTIRALRGLMTGTATTMTSGNLVGVRGEVACVGASGGFIYGAQGKILPTGTLSGSVWATGVFAQLDVSAATINAGQCAAIWGDWGTTGATATDLTGCRGVAFTNTTSNVLNAQDYRYGNATYLLELAGAGGTLNYYLTSGTSAGSAGDTSKCNAQKVIRVVINSVAAYIPVFTQNT